MFSSFYEILLGIIGLSIVVLVHESGHYFAARAVGIKVETFSIGFGRRIFGFKKNETEYRLSLIPLGGYCRFYGEQSFRQALDEKLDYIPGVKGEFYGSSPLKRIIVSFSGPLANILFAVFVFTMISWIGFAEYYTEPKIILASEWSLEKEMWPSDTAGLKSGDIIISVDGNPVDRFNELRRFLIFRPGEELRLGILRDGRSLSLTITPKLDRKTGIAIIGVLNWVDPVIAKSVHSSSAYSAGLNPGDRVLSINGRNIPHTVAFYSILAGLEEKTATIIVERQGEKRTLQPVSALNFTTDLSFRIMTGRSIQLDIFQALIKGFDETFDILSSTMKGMRMLFMGVELQNAVSGPIRLISDTGAVVAEGFRNGFGPGLLWSFELMSLISISLAFLNLLPIPVLDGGQIVLFVFEIIRRRQLNPKYVYRYQFIGTILVLLIAIAATTGDIVHLNGR